jgi:hypothetical protein
VQARGGPAEMEFLGDRGEVAELAQFEVHAASPAVLICISIKINTCDTPSISQARKFDI